MTTTLSPDVNLHDSLSEVEELGVMILSPHYCNDPRCFKNYREEEATLNRMKLYGGSFVQSLLECYYRADAHNRIRLLGAFKYFQEYKEDVKKEAAAKTQVPEVDKDK